MAAEGFILDRDISGGNGSNSEEAVLTEEELIYLNIIIHFLAYTNGCKHSSRESVSY